VNLVLEIGAPLHSLQIYFLPGWYSCCQKWLAGYRVSILHTFNHPSEV
jgi:hypothetical protein